MKVIDLAIIIPTLNEEHYIGTLLDSLSLQSVFPSEIIIVDATSKDKTKEEVLARKKLFPSLSFHTIPKQTISKQRNYGVRKAKANHIFFLDADMVCSDKQTIKLLWKKIQKKDVDMALCYVMPLSDETKDKLLYRTHNVLATVFRPIKPIGTTMNLYVKKSVFEDLDGFDESIRVGEDFEFLSRAARETYTFDVFRKPILYTSVRRLRYEGRVRFILKLARSLFVVTTRGYKKNKPSYKFGHFNEKV